MTNRLSYKEPSDFMGYVQLHERLWGLESYPGRPDLQDILGSPVVVLWQPTMPAPPKDKNAAAPPEPRFTLTLHPNLNAVQEYVEKVVLRALLDVPRQRVWKIFRAQREQRITGVTLTFEDAPAR